MQQKLKSSVSPPGKTKMGFFNFLGRQEVDLQTFEKELTSLNSRVQKTQSRIAGLRKTKLSVSSCVTSYVATFYILWMSYKIFTIKSGSSYQISWISLLYKAILSHTSISIGVPILAVCMRFLFEYLFDQIIKRQEHTLRSYLNLRRSKLAELKKKTNFDATQGMIDRFDSSNSLGQEKPASSINNSVTQSLKPESPRVSSKTQSKDTPDLQTKSSPTQSRRTLQDRLLDYIIGSDHNESVENRYALICERCFTHNGLASPNCVDPTKVLFICRSCGCLNGQKMLKDKSFETSGAAELKTTTRKPTM